LKPTIYIVLFLGLVFAKLSFAQDIHFSQFGASLLNISPGFTGLFDGDYRVGAIYRSQWQSVPVSYSTFNMNGEMRFKPKQLVKDMVGIGIIFNNDRAGDAHYGTTQVYLSGSYIFLAKPDSSLIMTLGANVGFCQVGFDYSKMTFDRQFDGFQFNQNSVTGEQFNQTNRSFGDINVGTAIQYILKHKHRFTYALGVHHVTSPVITYQGNDLSKLNFLFSNYLGYSTPISERTDIVSEVLLTNQGKNYELIPHLSLKYYFSRVTGQAILAGACFRTRDAVVARLGYTYKTLQSGIAYDINISKFTAATNRRGAFELFINYIIRLKPGFIAKKRACPVFM